ncbi:4473_t:CDS:2, partial [Dentiscutata erythropus]
WKYKLPGDVGKEYCEDSNLRSNEKLEYCSGETEKAYVVFVLCILKGHLDHDIRFLRFVDKKNGGNCVKNELMKNGVSNVRKKNRIVGVISKMNIGTKESEREYTPDIQMICDEDLKGQGCKFNNTNEADKNSVVSDKYMNIDEYSAFDCNQRVDEDRMDWLI